MIPPEIRSDPFSADDEAFFQSAGRGDAAALSERPVTLDDEAFVEEPFESAEREARRARFIRPVASLVAALGALTLVGLTRHALRTETNSFVASEPVPIAAAPSEAPATRAHDIAAHFVGPETDDSTALLMSTCDHSSTNPAVSTSATESAETRAFDAAGAEERPGAATSEPPSAEGKLMEQPAADTARTQRPSKAAPPGKAALLSAIRASRPSHGEPRKTL
jgi:hypothetical protein